MMMMMMHFGDFCYGRRVLLRDIEGWLDFRRDVGIIIR
jgi:hypothetical protein